MWAGLCGAWLLVVLFHEGSTLPSTARDCHDKASEGCWINLLETYMVMLISLENSHDQGEWSKHIFTAYAGPASPGDRRA